MRNILFAIMVMSMMMTACAGTKESTTPEKPSEGRPAPLEIIINKGEGTLPLSIQVVNRTKEVLTRMDVELTFTDTLTEAECETEIMLIGSKWQDIGDTRRVMMYPNSTDLFDVEEIELRNAPNWEAITAGWDNVIINGKITKTGYMEDEE
mgnify:CR=1 FL=1